MDKALKITKIAYYTARTLAGLADAVILGVFYLACTTKSEKEEKSNENTVECN